MTLTKQELAHKMQEAQAFVPGKKVKLHFGEEHGAILLDGQSNQVPEDNDGAADTTIKVQWEDWQSMMAGQLDGLTAFMPAKLTVAADLHSPQPPPRRR